MPTIDEFFFPERGRGFGFFVKLLLTIAVLSPTSPCPGSAYDTQSADYKKPEGIKINRGSWFWMRRGRHSVPGAGLDVRIDLG